MKMLKRFGFFDSLSADQIKPMIGVFAEGEKALIAGYLKSGKPLMMIAGIARDRLDPKLAIIGTQHALTDGEWAWTEDTAYYVEHYNLVPPNEFLQSMRRNGWVVPDVAHMEELQVPSS